MPRNLVKPNKPCWPYTINRSCDQAQGLIACWSRVENNRIIDIARGNNGTIIGTGPSSGFRAPGVGGGKDALFCLTVEDVSNTYATVTDTLALDLTGAITMSCWAYPIAFPSTGHQGTFFGKYDFVNTDNARAFLLYYDGSLTGVSMTVSGDGITPTTANGGTLTTFKWHHICGVYVPSTSVTTYINGVQVAQNTTSIPASLFNNGTQPLTIGSFGTGGIIETGNFGWHGSLEEFRLYNRAMSPGEVWRMYDPATRWSLRNQPSRRSIYSTTSSAPVTAPRLKITKGSDVYRIPISNFSASAAPASGNDASQGYTPGSRWVDTTHKLAYTCVDHTVGAAVWVSG